MPVVIPVYLSGGNDFFGTSRGITEPVYLPPVPAQTLSVVGIWLHGLQVFSKNTGFWSSHAECAGTWSVNQVSDVCLGTNCCCDANISNRNIFTKHPCGLTKSYAEQPELSLAAGKRLRSWVCTNTSYTRHVQETHRESPWNTTLNNL